MGATGVTVGTAKAKTADGSDREDATAKVIQAQLSAAAKAIAANAQATDGEAADSDVEYPADNGLHGPDVSGEDYECESCEPAVLDAK